MEKEAHEAEAANLGVSVEVWGRPVTPFSPLWERWKSHMTGFQTVMWSGVVRHCVAEDPTLSTNIFAKFSLFYKYLRGCSPCSVLLLELITEKSKTAFSL